MVLLRSGWVPATLALGVVVWLLCDVARVGPGEVVAFAGYVVVGLMLPGTIAWRLLDRRGDRPIVEILVLGTIVGYALEVPVYLACRAVGAPLMVLAWPAIVLVLSLSTSRGRRVWKYGRRASMPPMWSWCMAILVAYAVLWLAFSSWSISPLTPEALTTPYVDEPYHLALVGELRHHVPAEVPYVVGTPLRYHWLTYAHVASSSWATGIEPVILLKTLAPATMLVLTVLGAAVVTSRLARTAWPGVVAGGVLVLVTSVDVFGWTDGVTPWAGQLYLGSVLIYGPTLTFATMLSVLLLLLLVERLRGRSWPWPVWGFVGLLMVAVAGAKSTVMPAVIAGLLGVVLMALVTRRRPFRGPALLLGISVLAFLAAQQIFYGAGTRSLAVDPLSLAQASVWPYPGLWDASRQISGVTLAVAALSYGLAHVAAGAGVIGILGEGRWRGPTSQFLVGTYVAALGAALVLGHPALAQLYFLLSATPALVVAGSLGLARLARGTGSSGLVAGAVGVVGAVATLWVVPAVTQRRKPELGDGTPAEQLWRAVVVPQLLALAGVAALALVVLLVSRHQRRTRRLWVMTAVVAVVGLGLGRTVDTLTDAVRLKPPDTLAEELTPEFRESGPDVARWLRAHSSSEDLVATNVHCRPGTNPCDPRSFWISGFAERRVLVEGWAYVAPETVGLPSNDLTNSVRPPFWDLERLRASDAAIARPTAASISVLVNRYGVRWLFVDTGLDADVVGLSQEADLRYARGGYAVFELPRAGHTSGRPPVI